MMIELNMKSGNQEQVAEQNKLAVAITAILPLQFARCEVQTGENAVVEAVPNTSNRNFQRKRDPNSTHNSSNKMAAMTVSIELRLRHCCASSRMTRK